MITIVDYGMGNLRSVEKAFEFLGIQAAISADAGDVLNADHLVFPGVGAFGQAMQNIKAAGLDKAILAAVKQGTPFLGICLGMQLLFEGSEEGGFHEGLGLLPGTIRRLPGNEIKIPHMGWNTIETSQSALFDADAKAYVYFVHSYAMLDVAAYTIATSCHGTTFSAAVQKDNVMATQFHPEKSGMVGLSMLKRFAAL